MKRVRIGIRPSMRPTHLACRGALLVFAMATSWVVAADDAQQPPAENIAAPPAPAVAPAPADELALRQGTVSDRFKQFEYLLLRRAGIEAGANPHRAALLRRALQESQNQHLHANLESLVPLLNQQQLGKSIEAQRDAVEVLKKLLDLLSSDKPERLRN